MSKKNLKEAKDLMEERHIDANEAILTVLSAYPELRTRLLKPSSARGPGPQE